MPCMCGATDCPRCGPDQGYEVRRVWNNRRGCWTYINPEDDDEDEAEYGDDQQEDEDE